MCEWRDVKISDICDSVSITHKSNQQKIVLINTSDIYDGKVINHLYVENANLKGQFKKSFQINDILYSEIRPKNKRYAFVDFVADDYVASTKLMVIRCKNKIVLPEFLFQVLKSDLILNKLQMLAETRSGTFPQITFNELGNIHIMLPSLPEQREIAGMLSALDAKIELNNRINKNLEAQAQAIFKSWFVDFEPFRDGEFVDSELGPVPKGWRVGTLGNLINSTLGGDWGKDTPSGNYTEEVYCIRGADIPEISKGNQGKMPTRFILPKNLASKQLCVNDIVIEISGGSPTQSTGRCALIPQPLLARYSKKMICTNFCRAIKPMDGYSIFIYYIWKHLYDQGVMFSYENGTTGIKNLDINSFLANEGIVIPPKNILGQFDLNITAMQDMVFAMSLENEKLAALRDTLLPKLMSGEIRVPLEV